MDVATIIETVYLKFKAPFPEKLRISDEFISFNLGPRRYHVGHTGSEFVVLELVDSAVASTTYSRWVETCLNGRDHQPNLDQRVELEMRMDASFD